MINTEHTSKAPRTTTGLFALLGALLYVKGTSAPKTSQGSGAPSVRRSGRTFPPLARMKGCVPALLCAVVGLLAFTTTPALATAGHEFSGEFNGGAGHEFSDPTGVAVNNATGNVYVVDKGNNRVEEFSAKGAFIAEFKGSGTAGELSEPEEIAIDNSAESASQDPSVGDVYVSSHVEVAGESKGVVDKFSASGAYLGQITGTCPTQGETQAAGECMPSKAAVAAFGSLKGVAVDPKGLLWVYQEYHPESGSIDAFSDAASNAFLSSLELEGDEEPEPGLAVDSEDNLYYADEGALRFGKLNSMGKIIQTPGGTGRTGVAVDPSSNDVYIDSATPGNPAEEGPPEIQVYTSSETAPGGFNKHESPTETFGAAQLADGGGTALAVSYAPISSGAVYVLDSSANKVDMFIPAKAKGYFESFHFGSKGTGSGEFTEPLGIAVNDSTNPLEYPQAEDVYVVDKGNKRVEQFNSTGTKVEKEFAPPGGFNEPEAIAVDNSCQLQKPALTGLECEAFDPSDGDVYVTDNIELRNGGREGSGAVDKFSSTGTYLSQLRRCPEDEYSEGKPFSTERPCYPAGHSTPGFDAPLTGVVVGPEGNVWVGNANGYEDPNEFSDTGTFLGFVGDGGSPVWTGGPFGSAGPGVVAGSSALDPLTGELFVDRESSIDRYASDEESPSDLLETFPSTGLQKSQGIAISPAGTVYATERTADDVKAFDEFPLAQVAVGAIASLRPTSVTLQGSVNPEGNKVSSCEFEYGETTSYGKTAACEHPDAAEIGEGTSSVEVHADLEGLPSGTTYHYRLVASNAIGTNRGSDHLFTTPGPSVTEEQVGIVEATAATLQAQIDPDGGQTSYHFEYDTSPYTSGAPHGTSLPIPNASIGSGTSAVPVSVRVTGLQPSTTYYYRAVAEGEPLGTPEKFYGANETFVTNQAPGSAPPQNCPNEKLRGEQPYGLGLPDCRAYEMVSPVDTEGQDATDSFSETAPRAAVSGEAIIYSSKGTFVNPAGDDLENQFVSRRGPGGWSTQSVTPRHEQQDTEDGGNSFFSDDLTPELTEGVASSTAKLTSEAPAGIPGNLSQGLYVDDFANGSYRYINGSFEPELNEYLNPLGSSTDLTHVVFKGGEWVNGDTVPVTVTNEGESMFATVGAVRTGLAGGSDKSVWRAVSADGSRVYFTSPGAEVNDRREPEPPGQLYVRVNVGVKVEPEPEREQSNLNAKKECIEPAKACTIDVSASQRLAANPAGIQTALYQGASTDGSRVFFTSRAELTEDAYTGPKGEGANLYEYDLETGKLGDLTGKETDASGEGAAVQGVVQISEDGSYVYFVAKGALAAGATAGQPNLYVSHKDGAPVFIATLAANDHNDWHAGEAEGEGGPEQNTAVVSPGGDRLAFLSTNELTGYDNTASNGTNCGENQYGEPEPPACPEIFEYDAVTSQLVCASCNPTGARPVGPSSFTAKPGTLPPVGLYRARNLLEDGALFFDSSDALVPHAGDGRGNVYEYEDGHVYAISDVAGGYESFFMDASANGENVFFGTADRLLPQDTSNNVVVYDARVDGGFPVTVAPLACTTAEACRTASPPTPSVFGAPPSATFSGPGNVAPPPPAVVKPKSKPLTRAQKLAKALKVCAKDKQKSKRAKCQKQAKQKYGPTKKKAKAKKSSNDRRTKS